MSHTDREIEAAPKWHITQDVNDVSDERMGVRWGNWPLTRFQRDRGETRDVDGGGYVYSKVRFKVAGMFWLPWQWKRELSPAEFPWYVTVPNVVQDWIWQKSLARQTVTILGAKFTWEFLRGFQGPFNWIVWATGWPMFLFLKALRRAVR